MALDPSIILAGQPVNALGAITAANQAAAGTNQIRTQNALAQLYKTQGAGLMNGDPNALNALAAIDPAAAQGMAVSQAQLDRIRTDAKNAAADRAASMDAAKAKADADRIEKGVAMGLAAKSPQEWDAMMTQFGAKELVGQFDNRMAIAHSFLGIADALKAAKGPDWRAATPEEAASRGAAAGQINSATGEFKAINPPSSTSVTSDGQGGITIQQGPGVKPLTEAQGKDNMFAAKAMGALSKLEPVAGSLTSYGQGLAENDPTGIIRGRVQSGDYQVAKAAAMELLLAILRKESGAAITAQEMQQYGSVYLPQPGDGTEVLAAKKEARARAVEGIKSGMSPAQILAAEKASGAGTTQTPTTGGGANVDGYQIEEVK